MGVFSKAADTILLFKRKKEVYQERDVLIKVKSYFEKEILEVLKKYDSKLHFHNLVSSVEVGEGDEFIYMSIILKTPRTIDLRVLVDCMVELKNLVVVENSKMGFVSESDSSDFDLSREAILRNERFRDIS